MVPKTTTKVEGGDVKKLMTLMEVLEDNDDIQNLYSNLDVDEDGILNDVDQCPEDPEDKDNLPAESVYPPDTLISYFPIASFRKGVSRII